MQLIALLVSGLQARTPRTEVPQKKSVLPAHKSPWHRFIRHPLVMPYNRLALLVVLINGLVFGSLAPFLQANPIKVLDVVLINFSVALLIRQQYVINLLFKVATSIPTSWPLSIRWAAGKVYHFGGIHVGSFFAGTLWLSWFTFLLYQKQTTGIASWLLPLNVFHLIVLLTMIVASLPKLRAKYHNQFEVIARFGGWTSLLVFWIQSVALLPASPEPLMVELLRSPHFWILSLVTFSVALPWMRLRKIPVEITRPSSHVALANFNYGVTPFAGSSTDLSRNPLFEWHSFANVPSPNVEGYRLTISRAGDWTGRFIDDLPSHIWVKGIPTAGVGNIESLFKRVIWVATGSGIGPCLPHILENKVPSKLVWSTRNPRKTYGDALVNEILSMQPDATIWDTDANGKPDLVQLAYEAYRDFDAEAIICISNKKVTWHVNYQLESRGIPAFGAIWDS